MPWHVYDRNVVGFQLDAATAAIDCGHAAPVVPSRTTSAFDDASVVIWLVTSGAAGSWRTVLTRSILPSSAHFCTVSS